MFKRIIGPLTAVAIITSTVAMESHASEPATEEPLAPGDPGYFKDQIQTIMKIILNEFPALKSMDTHELLSMPKDKRKSPEIPGYYEEQCGILASNILHNAGDIQHMLAHYSNIKNHYEQVIAGEILQITYDLKHRKFNNHKVGPDCVISNRYIEKTMQNQRSKELDIDFQKDKEDFNRSYPHFNWKD